MRIWLSLIFVVVAVRASNPFDDDDDDEDNFIDEDFKDSPEEIKEFSPIETTFPKTDIFGIQDQRQWVDGLNTSHSIREAMALVMNYSRHVREWERDVYNDFANFVGSFHRTYESIHEIPMRFQVFKESKKRAEVRNQEEPGALFGVTCFSDLKPEEFIAKHTGLRRRNRRGKRGSFLYASRSTFNNSHPKGQRKRIHGHRQKQLPRSFLSPTTPVKNQGDCGGCYAFAVAAAVEGAYAKSTGRLVNLSEQQLLSCAKGGATGNLGCAGGFVDTTMKYAVDTGLGRDEAFRFRSSSRFLPQCRKISHVVRLRNYKVLPANRPRRMRKSLFNHGAIAVSLDARDLQDYKKGVIRRTRPNRRTLNHAVTIVGYRKGYWIVKNSWGKKWGEKGFFRVRRGKNVYGIESEPVVPII